MAGFHGSPEEIAWLKRAIMQEFAKYGLDKEAIKSYDKFTAEDVAESLAELLASDSRADEDLGVKAALACSAINDVMLQAKSSTARRIFVAITKKSPTARMLATDPAGFSSLMFGAAGKNSLHNITRIIVEIERSGNLLGIFKAHPNILGRITEVTSVFSIGALGALATDNSLAELAIRDPDGAIDFFKESARNAGILEKPVPLSEQEPLLFKAVGKYLAENGFGIVDDGDYWFDKEGKKIHYTSRGQFWLFFHEFAHAFEFITQKEYPKAFEDFGNAYDSMRDADLRIPEKLKPRMEKIFGEPSKDNTGTSIAFNPFDESRTIATNPGATEFWADMAGHPSESQGECMASMLNSMAFGDCREIIDGILRLKALAQTDGEAEGIYKSYLGLVVCGLKIGGDLSKVLRDRSGFGNVSPTLERLDKNLFEIRAIAKKEMTGLNLDLSGNSRMTK